MTANQQFEFARLVEGLFAGALTDADAAQLVAQLTADEEAFALYNRMLSLDVALEWSLGTRCEQDVLAIGSEHGALPASARAERLAAIQPNFPRRSSTFASQAIRILSAPVLRYAALVALCLYGSFALIAWNLRPDKSPNFAGRDNALVAVVRDTADVEWSKNSASKSAESSILSGESLKIESGTIELQLNAGTKLFVEGPAEWSCDAENSVSLHHGKLLARVPEQAIGFTVETPTAKVVDLGTEFGVEVSKSGATDVQVIKGKIELRPDRKAGKSLPISQPIILSAGQARYVERNGSNGSIIVREVPITPERFLHPDQVRQIRIEGALASNTFGNTPEADVRHLINGDGLKGDRHSADRPDTMWNTDFTRVKNVFVNFDLGAPYRLNALKVWNYNEAPTLWRGVKRADIYVSTSGKGDPLSEPDEWKLAVADQLFAPATGKADYATPTVVPLGDVEGRFVSIVIEEALGGHPNFPNGAHDCVGLSEVQIFGSRVERPKLSPKQQ
jgi:hypothetical protein